MKGILEGYGVLRDLPSAEKRSEQCGAELYATSGSAIKGPSRGTIAAT
jgi:hypothetical protein